MALITKNPWETLDLNTYENHMNLKTVAQIPLLNKIMKSQLFRYTIDFVAILLVAVFLVSVLYLSSFA